MGKQVFLHIGLPKTATSRIQMVLQKNQLGLAEINAHYLQSPQNPLFHDNGHHILAVDLMRSDWGRMQLQMRPDEVERAWELAIAEIESVPATRCIISSEWFCFGVHTHRQLSDLQERLQTFEVHIVLALRDVVGFADSLYAQRVRDGFAGTSAEFIAETWSLMNWSALTNRWAAVFGADNVIALNFNDLADPVGEFLRYTIGLTAENTMDMTGGRRNQALPGAAIELIRQVNASQAQDTDKIRFRDAVRDFFDYSEAILPTGHYFSREAQEMLVRHCVWPRTVNSPNRPSANPGSAPHSLALTPALPVPAIP